ncbi:hypothetical protein SNK03_006196 [Fusarium graminearum]
MIARRISKTIQITNREERTVVDSEYHPGNIIGTRRGSDEYTLLTTTTSIMLPMHNPVFLNPRSRLYLGVMTVTASMSLTNRTHAHGILNQALENLPLILPIILLHTPTPLTLTATSLALRLLP